MTVYTFGVLKNEKKIFTEIRVFKIHYKNVILRRNVHKFLEKSLTLLKEAR